MYGLVPLSRTDAHDGRGDDLAGGYGSAQHRSGQDHRTGGELRGKRVNGLHLVDAGAHGLDDLEDPFMRNGLRLVVDGTDGNVIRTIMENEMNQIEARHMDWIGILNAWAGFAPGFGMMGTVLGLIGMLNNLEDKSSLGPNMAVALITTLYGSMMANWLIAPFSTKLLAHNAMEMRSKEMIIEGVLAIQAGENPRIMGQKLLTYLDPVTRKVIEADVLKD